MVNRTDKKLSFDQIASETDNSLHNSNMQNLVSAVRRIDDEVEQLEGFIKQLKEIRDEITTFAKDDKNLQNTSEVSRLYQADSKVATHLRNRNW